MPSFQPRETCRSVHLLVGCGRALASFIFVVKKNLGAGGGGGGEVQWGEGRKYFVVGDVGGGGGRVLFL